MQYCRRKIICFLSVTERALPGPLLFRMNCIYPYFRIAKILHFNRPEPDKRFIKKPIRQLADGSLHAHEIYVLKICGFELTGNFYFNVMCFTIALEFYHYRSFL